VKSKLTPTQLTVLRDAKAGHVYRSESGHDLYACYSRAGGGNKKVTAVVDRLSALGLLRIGPQDRMLRPWLVTEQGEEVLAQGVTP
jgi:hypothetical protein